MSGFRLLGIVPLKGCNEKFYKNLTIGTPYKFNNNVIIELDDDFSKIKKVQLEENHKTKDLYKLKNGINVEVSAIVGLNGSGKSALIELLYYSVYAFSIYNNKKRLIEEHSNNIQYQIDKIKKIDLKKSNSLKLFKILNNNNLTIDKKDFEKIKNGQELLKEKLIKHKAILQVQKNNDEKIEKLIKEELAIAIVFKTLEGIFSVVFRNGEIKVSKYNDKGVIESEHQNFFFNPFFYSICLNYSHHSLNSKVIGNWINSLFHKNDGYATPVVINPMRDHGNFNINRELHLSNERIMSNLTYDVANNTDILLLKKYELKKFLFRAKKDITLIKYENFENVDFDKLKSVKLVRSVIGKQYLNKRTVYQDYALGYIEKKIDKIKNNYTNLFLDKKGNFSHSKFMAFLKSDKSHITKKLRTTINFLKKTDSKYSIWNTSNHRSYKELNIKDFKLWLNENNTAYDKLSPSDLMNFALPGFFNIDFKISTKTGTDIKLSELSSGEQQMIFNINTIMYHLYNLQSIHSEKGEQNDDLVKRLAYKNISIILDEIEIYYHPDMQRELTFNLLNSFENIKEKGRDGIESIHLIYLTHSPFILSDIPSSNILRLNDGNPEPEKQQTFGANIHQLLHNDFFLENGFIGEFAKNKINEVVDFLRIIKWENHIKLIKNKIESEKDEKIKEDLKIQLQIIELEKSRVKTLNKSLTIKKCKEIIDLVGEPILKDSLNELYNDVLQLKKGKV